MVEKSFQFLKSICNATAHRWIFCAVFVLSFAYTFSNGFDSCAAIWLGLSVWRLWREKNRSLWCLAVLTSVVWGGRAWQYHYVQRSFEQLQIDQPYEAILYVDSSDWQVNGDLVTMEAMIEIETDGQLRSSKVAVIYQLNSQSEQDYFLTQTKPLEFNVTVQRQVVEANRNRYGFDYAEFLKSKHLPALFKIKTIHTVREQHSLVANTQTFRNMIVQKVLQAGYSKTTAFASALLLGEKQQVFEEQQIDYKKLGVSHLLTISGLHISLLMAAFLTYSWRIGITRESSYVLLIILLLWYGWLISWSISGTRAIVMGIFLLLKKLFRKKIILNQWDFFALVTVGTILYQPYVIYNTAFKLSYGMTFVLLLIQATLKNTTYSPFQQTVIQLVMISLFVVPLMALHFFEFNVLSTVLTIILTVFFAYFILPLLVVYVIAILIQWQLVTQAVQFLVENGLNGCDWVLSWLSEVKLFRVVTGYGSVWLWSIYLLFVLVIIYFIARQQLTMRRIVVCLGLIFILISSSSWHMLNRVIFIDVGQGDATAFIQKGHNQVILVDTGGLVSFQRTASWQQRKTVSFAEKTVVAALKAEGISTIDYVILTHADTDHIGNLKDLVKHINVQSIIMAKGMETVPEIQALIQELPSSIEWHTVTIGDELKYKEIHIQFLGPQELSDGSNETSLSMSIDFMQQKWLLLGDLDQPNEKELLVHFPALQTNILKLAHHGSKSSSSSELIEQTAPQIAIISAGKNNRYHHPHKEVLDRLARYNLPYLRTDQHGAIHFVEQFDQSITIETILTNGYE